MEILSFGQGERFGRKPTGKASFIGLKTTRSVEKWSRLFEQLSPIYKWISGGLRLMSRDVSKGSSYAASFNCGKAATYFSCGVNRSRLECGRCVLYQPRYSAMSARAALTSS